MYINSTGYYIPEARVGNDHYAKILGVTPDWLVQRSGVQTRSRAGENDTIESMGMEALDRALEGLPYDVKEVDLIVAAHYCVYDTVATLGHRAQRNHGIRGAKVVYVSSACSSFINGMEVIETYFAAGKATKALLICSEMNTYYSNEQDPKSGHLWGDAAVAYFFSKEKVSPTDIKVRGVFTEGLACQGKGPDGVNLRPKTEGITMRDGRDVFLNACKSMIYALNKVLEETGTDAKDLTKLITHQANKRIVAQVAHMMDRPMDDFLNNIEELGNTGSISAALVLAQHKDEFKPGDLVPLMVFGGGYSCAATLLEF